MKFHCKYCAFFTTEVEENLGHIKTKVGRCAEYKEVGLKHYYVTEDYGCGNFRQCFGIRCGGFPKINGKLYFGENKEG